MIETAFAQQFAAEWIAAWNSHDLERILSHYTEDFEMRSPIIVERMRVATGVLHGKEAVRTYWGRALAAAPNLRFELHDVLVGIDAIVLYYHNFTRGKMVAESLTFNAERQVMRAAAHYGRRVSHPPLEHSSKEG
jgi:ketosteroid isomerase-like protein